MTQSYQSATSLYCTHKIRQLKGMSNTRLVWSDDPKDKKAVEDAKGPAKPAQASEEFVKSRNWCAVFRIEKSGRGGKTVTVIDRLPKQEIFLKQLCKELKAQCGTGGTYLMDGPDGVIEIQGDKRAQIKAIFDKKGFKHKGH